ncbi:hypothetical protein [Cupriavidus basilensis]|uniref:hypothetical protein n=1 Tax=Cupriavidus basilensis TaxID=68895 RepID=UPI002851A5E2|nr:hypothetical protein [Cupriavidus basilensis]MDR3381734.1 hypothetical protein [Cupriavidus basilensis]
MKLVLWCTAAAILAGCAVPVQQKTYDPLPFNAAEYEALPKTGTGVVRGQVFLKTRGGDVKKGAGAQVILSPATSLSEQSYAEGYKSGKTPRASPGGGETQKYWRRATADADGRFEIRDVPPGKFFVMSELTWEAPTQFGLAKQGGIIIVPVLVENGKTSDAMVTK